MLLALTSCFNFRNCLNLQTKKRRFRVELSFPDIFVLRMSLLWKFLVLTDKMFNASETKRLTRRTIFW